MQVQLLLDLALMAIPRVQQLARLLSRNVSQFLRSLLLVSQPFYPVFQRLVLLHLLFENLLLLAHFDPRDYRRVHLGVAPPAEGVLGGKRGGGGRVVLRLVLLVVGGAAERRTHAGAPVDHLVLVAHGAIGLPCAVPGVVGTGAIFCRAGSDLW